ncbi:MAG: gliding motility-associated C-terminal domain-containing protein [Flavobacteriales bacterium]|nr:gliding motility-associated C-terminal domain-containing protein [Flavobacteriales bacterium]
MANDLLCRIVARFTLFAVCLVLPFFAVAALPPTDVRCATVAPGGQVTITWAPPADPLGEFSYYQVYSATSAAGPFAPAGTVPALSTTMLIDAVADGTAGPVFYYITTFTTGGQESAPGDTLSTIFLQVSQSAPLGSAVLSWNHLAVPPSAADSFAVWMEYPIGTWQRLAMVGGSTFSYRHEITICEDSLTFQIRREGEGCAFGSNRTGDVFRDVTPPSIPVVVAVTVDTSAAGNGLATVHWAPSPQPDTDGYIIVFNAPGGPAIVDTVWGWGSTSYEWADATPGFRPESYSVAAFDTCMTGNPPSPNTSATQPFHTTMFLDYTYDACVGLVELLWTPYVGWPVQEYTVYTQVDTGPWSSGAVVNAGTTSLQVPVDPFHTYCFAVAATQGAGLPNSISNRVCVLTDYPGLPVFNYLRTVTVSGQREITVVDSVDALAWVRGYRLERSENGGPYEAIAFLGQVLSNTFTYTDTDVDPATTGYRYRVVVVDDCGHDALTSNIGSNIVLTATPDLNGVNTLAWNGYQLWDGTLGGHTVYRRIGTGPEQVLQVVPPHPWTIADDVSAFTSMAGRFCYTVEAMEVGNPSGINAVSRSNEACAVQEELVFIPNAFVVGGHNPIFKPQLANVGVAAYELSIINRWGQVFWTTTDPQQGWDGTASGKPVPMGVYAYYCKFRNGEGREFEKRGTVTMLTAVDQ